jgi:sugar-specific transcriptional regulator TrmB
MYKSVLLQVGLSEDEAEVYEALLLDGPKTAGPLLLRLKSIKRGTLYQVLRRLGERGLVRESSKEGKTLFVPESPDVLGDILTAQESVIVRGKEALNKVLPEMRSKSMLADERPLIRFFEGVDGLKDIYEDHIASSAKELFFVRTGKAGVYADHLGKWWAHYKRRRMEKGMVSHAITPDDPIAEHDAGADELIGIVRTWIRPEDYSAPVEIDVYGDTVAVISFGKEIFGITVTNPQIAKAFLDIFRLAERGAQTIEVTHDHPSQPPSI